MARGQDRLLLAEVCAAPLPQTETETELDWEGECWPSGLGRDGQKTTLSAHRPPPPARLLEHGVRCLPRGHGGPPHAERHGWTQTQAPAPSTPTPRPGFRIMGVSPRHREKGCGPPRTRDSSQAPTPPLPLKEASPEQSPESRWPNIWFPHYHQKQKGKRICQGPQKSALVCLGRPRSGSSFNHTLALRFSPASPRGPGHGLLPPKHP